MDLIQLKIKKGPNFGDLENEDTESLFKRLECFSNRCAIIDNIHNVERYGNVGSVSSIPCTTDDEVINKTLKLVSSSTEKFICIQFHELQTYLSSTPNRDKEKCAEIVKKLDHHMNEINQLAPPNTLIIAVTNGDLSLVRRLQERKTKIRKKAVEAWTKTDEDGLEAVIQRARQGRSFFCIKQ